MSLDQTLTCVDCQQSFTFSAKDQDFFAEKGFSTPKRCKNCRDAKKAERDNKKELRAGGERGSSGFGD